MIEEELFNEVKQGKGIDEPCLFPKQEWDSLIEWHPVAKDPYESASKEVKQYHDMYEKMWLRKRRLEK